MPGEPRIGMLNASRSVLASATAPKAFHSISAQLLRLATTPIQAGLSVSFFDQTIPMSFQTPITIAEALDNIEHQRYLLPAIQREFEWPPDKIEWLFDSLMRGYPISSFLFWNVEDRSKPGYKFYQFLRVFRERFKTHNEEANMEGAGNFTAVLDGQQRLTSLYIGLKGSYAYKEYKYGWVDNERNIPTRHLYLNVSHRLEGREDGREYEFSFLKDSDTRLADLHDGAWFRVGKILDLRNISSFNSYVTSKGLPPAAIDILARLQEVIFSDRIINYFLEKEQDLDKALNIFIRINSGGLPLNFSDLIMSIAVANWDKLDARTEIHRLVDHVREIGFSISKDFVFKTYLYLHSRDIRFKVTNFRKENALNFEKDWPEIREAIEATFRLIRSFGYLDHTLPAKNAVIPIIYYLYHRGIWRDFETAIGHKQDRDVVRKWLHVITLKRVFGGQSDGTLTQIRRAFTSDVSSDVKIDPAINGYPVTEIENQIRRDTSIGDEFVEDLLRTQKDDRYAFCVMALLSPNLDYRNNDFHKDHLHPISAFTRETVEALQIPDQDAERFLSPDWNNSIINLQMLDSNENMSKQDKGLEDWVELETKSKDRGLLLDRCFIPAVSSLKLEDFCAFAEARKAVLKAKLLEVLA